MSITETSDLPLEYDNDDPTAYEGVRYDEIGAKLRRAFGDGEHVTVRERWYDRVQGTCAEIGPKAMEIVLDLARRAKGKDRPDRWFIASITRQFEEHRWW